tara:strand:+ start:137 stop:337 length:201 start_codon:yes stop_codon:yes gene_type:complete
VNPYDLHPDVDIPPSTKKSVEVKSVLSILEEAMIDASNSFEFGHLSGEAFTAIIDCLSSVKERLEK